MLLSHTTFSSEGSEEELFHVEALPSYFLKLSTEVMEWKDLNEKIFSPNISGSEHI